MIITLIAVGAAALTAGIALRGERESVTPKQVADMAVASAPAPMPATDKPAATAPKAAGTAMPSATATKDSRRNSVLHASQALAAYRSTFMERCWTPSKSGPDHVDLRFNLAFDPEGTLVGVGISDSRKAFRADVSACLRGLSVKLKIPPPGVAVQVQVPLTLP